MYQCIVVSTPVQVCEVCLTGGGGGQGHRREGELDGIDQDFDDTQVEVNLAGKQAKQAINQG